MSESHIFPVLPLRETVLFPGVATPIAAGRPGTLEAVRTAADSDDRRVFVVCQRENVDEVTPKVLYTVGTIARIRQVQRSENVLEVVLAGEERGVAARYEERDGRLDAIVNSVESEESSETEDAAFLAMVRELRERAAELGAMTGLPQPVVHKFLDSVESPGELADLVASYLDLPAGEQQRILEIFAVEERLRLVLLRVERQIAVLEAQEEIKSKVQQELGDRQREMVLREQMKAIQEELGDSAGDGELEDLKEQLAELDLPEEARREVDRELKRLDRINPEAMEYQVIRTYLETVAELPWNDRSEESLDLTAAGRILDEDHYALDDVKDRVLEFLAVRQLRQQKEEAAADDDSTETDEPRGNEDDRVAKGPILLFAGPPGVGKTSIAKSIARAMGREYVRASLGGVRDEADIRGHRRTYVGAMPGRIIHGIKQAGTKNPVFLLDEVDKLGVGVQGDPASALLEVLDPAQNDTFVDHYLGVPFDLSEVLFIATANFVENIPSPLLDRMEMVEFSGYTEGEKLEIARRFLLPRQRQEKALTEEEISVSDEAVSELISRYTREAGVRQLERSLGRLARKVARRIAADETTAVTVDEETVEELLGRPKIRPEEAAREDQIGVATGMYYTPAGGDIMFVEAAIMPGKGKLTLTGQLGDVMKESGMAAWSYARAHGEELAIDAEQFERDVHLHVPAGAIPKDGPSAGITMATALVSAMSERAVRHDLAMSGEVTLAGRVLPIGGVKEKVLGAVRAGITEIVLPAENENHLDDLSDEVRESLTVHTVQHLADVLELALEPVAAPPETKKRSLETGVVETDLPH